VCLQPSVLPIDKLFFSYMKNTPKMLTATQLKIFLRWSRRL